MMDYRQSEGLIQNVWKGLPQDSKLEIQFTLKLQSYDRLPQKVDVRNALYYAIRDLHGTVGLAVDYELSSYNANDQSGLILVHADGLKKLWSSLTLIKAIDSIKCFFALNSVKTKEKACTVSSEVVAAS